MENENQAAVTPEVTPFDDFFGTPETNANFTKKTYLYARKVGDGETVIFRVAPPIKKQRKTGRVSHKHSVHFGFYRSNQKDPNGKGWLAPFLCIEKRDFKTKMNTQSCPACDRILEMTQSKANREAEIRSSLNLPSGNLNAQQNSALKAALKNDEQFSMLDAWCKQFNVNRRFYLAGKFLDTGLWGNIQIPSTANTQMEELVKQMGNGDIKAGWAKATDPKAGVYFAFSRGKDNFGKVMYSTKVYMVDVDQNGETYQKVLKCPISPTEIPTIEKMCMDVSDSHGAAVLTEEQIQTVVSEGEGNPGVLTAIWDTLTFTNTVDGEVGSAAATTAKAQTVVPKTAKVKEDLGGAMREFRKSVKTTPSAQAVEDELLASLQDDVPM